MILDFIPTFSKYEFCHASTVCLLKDKTLVAYYAGKYEGHRKTGIWLSIKRDEIWFQPTELFNSKNITGRDLPCWNPVLFQDSEKLFLYFKIGKSPAEWIGFYSESIDFGETWLNPKALNKDIVGPVRSMPFKIGNCFISGSSNEMFGGYIHFELSNDGINWKKVIPDIDSEIGDCIQPALVKINEKELIAYARSSSGVLVSTSSNDSGKSWSKVRKTKIPNPDSAIEIKSIDNNFHLLVYNKSSKNRSPLILAYSNDGINWNDINLIIEGDGEYSYPSMSVYQDDLIITFSNNRKFISFVTFNVDELKRIAVNSLAD